MTLTNDVSPALCDDRDEARKTVGTGERDKQLLSPSEILNQAERSTVDRVVEIERLAALEPIEYDLARTNATKQLGVRAHVLDREVAKKRRDLGLDTEDDSGQGRVAKIADVLPWHEPVNGDRVATTLAAAIKNYAVLSDAQVDTIAVWVLQTWMVNTFTIAPRLAVTSPTKGCGKTTVLSILSKVTRRPKRVGSISPPAMFRVVEQFQPTLILDETEKYVELGGDLHALLNEGHRKGATVMRVLGENMELREFAVFAAAAYARNGKIPDDLEQRSIVIEMQRRRPDEPLAELREDRCEPLQTIARMCARWADDVVIDDYDPDMGGLINRTADNWRSLFAIADLVGEDWPQRIRAAAAELAPREADSHGTILLSDTKAIFDGRTGEWSDRIFSEELAEALAAIEGGRWAEYGKARKPITKNQLAQLLKGFKVIPASVRIGAKSIRGYHRHQFEDAWQRYLGAQGVNETPQRHNPIAAGTSAVFQGATEKPVVAVEKCEKSLRPNGFGVVAFKKGENAPAPEDDDLGIPDFLRREPLPESRCEQCRGDVDGTEQLFNGHTLHRECIRFWRQNGAVA